MPADRRKERRESSDRRRESRRDTPLWAYGLAVLALGAVLAVFWRLIY